MTENCVKTSLSSFTLGLAIMLLPMATYAEIPTPPKRPDKLNVPISYIEKLKSGKIDKDGSVIQTSAEIDHEEEMIAQLLEEESDKNLPEINNVTKDEILNILEGKTPIPAKKPNFEQETSTSEDMASNKESSSEDDGTSLVSFALQPAQIEMDDNTTKFLKDYVVKTLNENSGITLEIHAYARPIDNEEYSDVRLALARALGVRSFLINNHIDPSRMKLSPMGRDSVNDSDDRIDLLFIEN